MPRYIDAEKIPYYCTLVPNADPRKCYFKETADKRDIDKLPTISPDEVRGVGEWEQKEIYGVEETTIEQMQSACCSVCGKYHTTPFRYYFSEYNYCPNCGARMGVSEDA